MQLGPAPNEPRVFQTDHSTPEHQDIAERGLILLTEVGSTMHGVSQSPPQVAKGSPNTGQGGDDVDEMGICIEPPTHVIGGERLMTGCVFCPENWANLDIVRDQTVVRSKTHSPEPGVEIIQFVRPLNPITPGHLLVIHREHTDSAADGLKGPTYASECMHFAAGYVRKQGIQANIITSIGPDATQSVMHTHLHVVPRTEGDGLPLPWTPQQAFAAGTGCLDDCAEGHTYTARCLLGRVAEKRIGRDRPIGPNEVIAHGPVLLAKEKP